jgi:hypothetical protein
MKFKAIENYDYSVSNHGHVKNNITGKILAQKYNRSGYQTIVLYKDGYRRTFRVDKLVANAFIPNIENLKEVEHIDDCRWKNNVKNLRFCYFRKYMPRWPPDSDEDE